MNETAFIVCSRLASTRVPGKALRKINGKASLVRLIDRLSLCGHRIFVAVPECDLETYRKELPSGNGLVYIVPGCESDPLKRMYNVAKAFDIKNVIRVTHDKVFIDGSLVPMALNCFLKKNLDYLYSSSFTDGSAFEIMSFSALEKASQKFKDIEHISYAIKAVTDNSYDMPIPGRYMSAYRFLIDYEKDIDLMELIFSTCGDDCSLIDAITFMDQNQWANDINSMPQVSIYTCAYNSKKWVEQCIKSVTTQDSFSSFEYVFIDDASIDNTLYLAHKSLSGFSNCRIIKNHTNLGLSSSSNVALKNCRGKFIVRLDADDFFVSSQSVLYLLSEIYSRDLDIVFPNNYYGSLSKVQNGKEAHHVGGAIFRTKAINHIKFTDGLRGYEGLDLFLRAREQLQYGYINRPLFFYRQHDQSMSKNNLVYREQLRKELVDGR